MTRRCPELRSAVLVAALAWLVACENEAPVESLAEAESFLGADMITTGGVHTITNAEGIRSAYLQFDTMYQWNDSTRQALRGVDLTVYNPDGSARGRVTSLRGQFDPRGESLTAQGNVVLVIPGDSRRLETEELHYDPELEQLWSDSAFVMYEGTETREGCSFRTDLTFQNLRVTGMAGGGCP
jgi:LPS export ABC transporter protein LptC